MLEDVRTDAQKDELYQERIARCTPVAKKAIAIVAKNLETIVLGESAECTASIVETAREILELFVAENVRWSDRPYVLSLVLQPFAHINEKISASLDMSWDKALGILFGKDYLDLTFGELNDVLMRKPEVVE